MGHHAQLAGGRTFSGWVVGQGKWTCLPNTQRPSARCGEWADMCVNQTPLYFLASEKLISMRPGVAPAYELVLIT